MAANYPPPGSPPAPAELIVRTGPQPGQRIRLARPAITLGREAGNDVVISDAHMSRRHASLSWDGSRYILQDLGSANGTFVNGVRLVAPQVVQSGDVISLGPGVSLVFQLVAYAAPPPVYAAPPPAHFAPPPPPRSTDTAYVAAPAGKRGRGWVLPVAIVLIVLCGLLAIAGLLGYYYSRYMQPTTRPVVTISSPAQGERVALGQDVLVQSVARDAQKIERVELWVDGQLERAESSNLPGGMSPFPLLADWQPAAAGTHQLTVRAFNSRGEPGHASVSVEATATPDRDADGVPDDTDACPDVAGTEAAQGCPDRDGDGIADATDACPDVAGLPEAGGCPAASAGDRDGDGLGDTVDRCPDEAGSPATEGCPDRDGDGVHDSADRCPDAPGLAESGGCPAPGDRDGDGVADADDACPDEAGLPDLGGCLDGDADGVRDALDACPEEPGLAALNGCPDRDGDGIRDGEDACPDEAGPAERRGCPDSGAGDRDGDGVPDDSDTSPDEPGGADSGGSPGPGGGTDSDGDGIPDDDEEPTDPADGFDFGLLLEAIPFNPVEFQALNFEVDGDYDSVYAYAGLAGADMDRYGPFDSLGERRWDIAEYLGGEHSIHLSAPADRPLEVRVTSGALNEYRMPDGIEATYWDLGGFIREHPPSDWDGHVITAESEGGDGGRGFRAQYRICAGSCESAAFQPPVLNIMRVIHRLMWTWRGDRSSIDGFKLYVNNHFAMNLPASAHSHSIRAFEPPCGTTYTFHMTAYEGDRESPPSNTVSWEGGVCPRRVRVTFQSLDTGNMDEYDVFDDDVGPVYGGFHVSGAGELQRLEFGTPLELRSDQHYSIQRMFDQIRTEAASCLGSGCPDNHAPDVNYIMVELGPDDDLTFGGLIKDDDLLGSDTLFEEDLTLAAGDITPGEYTINNRRISLHALIDIEVGPEAGAQPDLTITNISAAPDSGQLRVHVFNNAADLTDQNVGLRLVRLGTGETVGTTTYEHVNIPAGTELLLQGAESGIEPWDLRATVDPDNRIAEIDETNNTYETPAVMRVEFLEAGAGHCNENSCSIFDCDSEHVFGVWAGHRAGAGDIHWVARDVRFPRDGHLNACGREEVCTSSAPSRWRMEGDARYTFEFPVKRNESLHVMVTGYEQDHLNDNDSLGEVAGVYGPDHNWGARDDVYSGSYGRETPCDDTFCVPCPNGLYAQWRITRVH